MNEYDKKFEKGMRDYVEMTYDWDKEKEVLDGEIIEDKKDEL